MADQKVTIAQLKEIVSTFVNERDWNQFHSPKNMSMAIAVEAAELMEHFLWVDGKASVQALEKNRQEIEDEIADIAGALLMFCDENNIDLSAAIERKMALNRLKYPTQEVKGFDPFQLKQFKDTHNKKK